MEQSVPTQEVSVLQKDIPVQTQKKSPLITIAIYLFLIAATAMTTYAFTKPKDSDNLDSTSGNTITPTVTVTATPTTEKIAWKTYTNTSRKYSIQYPEEWTLDATKAELPADSQETEHLFITKGQYKIQISWPYAFGPQICLFDDEDKTDAPEIAETCAGAFTDIVGSKGMEHRRLQAPTTTKGSNTLWIVYTKEPGGYFATLPPISYLAPKDYEQATIEEMDQILKTFATLE